jgi:hypothetical protein
MTRAMNATKMAYSTGEAAASSRVNLIIKSIMVSFPQGINRLDFRGLGFIWNSGFMVRLEFSLDLQIMIKKAG